MKRFAALMLGLIWLLPACLALAAEPPEIPITESDEKTLVLSFAGDCTLGSENKWQWADRHFVPLIEELGFAHPFSGVKAIFEADDLTLVNLEGTFTNYNRGAKKKYVFRAPPEFAEILPLGSVETVTLANNHTMDLQERGFEDTKAALEGQGIAYCGPNIATVVEIKGVKIGLLGETSPRKFKFDFILETMEQWRKDGVDLIIASMHWGAEYSYLQNELQVQNAHFLMDAGVDIIVGHHPHVLQGVELYEGRPIFYSVGNFSFGGNKDPRDWDTMIAQVSYDISGEKPELTEIRLIPCVVSDAEKPPQDFRPVPVVGERAQSILAKVAGSSEGLCPEELFETGYYRPNGK